MKNAKKSVVSKSRALRTIVAATASSRSLLIMFIFFLSTQNVVVVVQGFTPPRPVAIAVIQQHSKARFSPLLARTTFTSPRSSGRSRCCYLHQTNAMFSSSSSVMLVGGGNHSSYSPPVFMKKNINNKQMTTKKQEQQQHQVLVTVLPKLTVIALIMASIWWKRQALLTFISFVKNEWLVTSLKRCHAAGPMGLVLYTLLFLVWEMTLGMTTPVEMASGMAFGAVPAIIANGLAKTGGAFFTFFLAQHVFAKRLEKYIEEHEILSLMQESIQETPFRIALLCRFSPLPEFVKNAGMGVMAAKSKSSSSSSTTSSSTSSNRQKIIQRCFLASLLLHGFSFTCLWTCMGAESARVMLHGQPPSMLLKYLVTGATWIGLGAPVLIGIWIKSLKDKQRQRRDEVQQDSSSKAMSSSSSSSSSSSLATDAFNKPSKSQDS